MAEVEYLGLVNNIREFGSETSSLTNQRLARSACGAVCCAVVWCDAVRCGVMRFGVV